MQTEVKASILIEHLQNYAAIIQDEDPAKVFPLAIKMLSGNSEMNVFESALDLLEADYLLSYNRLFEAFYNCSDDLLDPRAGAIALRKVWVDSGFETNGGIRELITVFDRYKHHRDALMNFDEIEVLDEFPEELTIYRGNIYGDLDYEKASWTLDRQVADYFTFTPNYPNGLICTAKARKTDILAYFAEREESEIIFDPEKITKISISQGRATEFPESFGEMTISI